MITALLLIFFPIPTWERLVVARRRWIFVLLIHLLPLLLLVSAAEAYGLARWPRPRGQMSQAAAFAPAQAAVYEAMQVVLSLIIVVILTRLIKSLGETFHGRHNFTQAFTVAAYSLGPMFLLRIFNAFPGVSPWVTWGVGAVLAAVVLYHGLPRIMLPDPPHAFGLFLMSVLLLWLVTGLTCFLTVWYLQGKFVRLDALISKLAAFLPF